jgi:hypothetical protein
MKRGGGIGMVVTVALGVAAFTTWIKWNEGASDVALKEKLAGEIRHRAQAMFDQCDLDGLTLRDLKVSRTKNTATFNGEIIVPRRRFATGEKGAIKRPFFEPTGMAVIALSGRAAIYREPLAPLPLLGAVHPVWGNVEWMASVPNSYQPDVNSLFDAHFDSNRDMPIMPLIFGLAFHVQVMKILLAQKRCDEVVPLFKEYTHYWSGASIREDTDEVGQIYDRLTACLKECGPEKDFASRQLEDHVNRPDNEIEEEPSLP